MNAHVGSLVHRLALEAILPGELPTMVPFAWTGGPYVTLAIVTALNSTLETPEEQQQQDGITGLYSCSGMDSQGWTVA